MESGFKVYLQIVKGIIDGMGIVIKERIKKLMCRCFGHNEFEEVYAERCDHLWGFEMPTDPKTGMGSKLHYIVFTKTECKRCGETIVHQETRPMRRAELLKEGWFICNNKDYDNNRMV